MSKLQDLMDVEGLEEDDLWEMAMDCVVPGICMNPDCDYTTQVEPDCDEGFCEFCNAGTVKALTILMGVI